MSDKNQQRIVIVGGGAGGLELATRLGKRLGRSRRARIILVDGSPTHIWKPLLHEVATGALNTGEDEVNYFAHAHHHGYEFEYGWMDGLDRERKVIRISPVTDEYGHQIAAARELAYDTLVLAVGAVPNDFGTPGVAEHCLFLNSQDDAERLRKRILSEAFSVTSGDDPASELRIGIVGGGATGVELAAEIHHTVTELHAYGAQFRPEQLQIYIIEGAPRILAGAPETMSSYATAELAKRHIDVVTGVRVASADARGFALADGRRIDAVLRIWAAGVKAPDWLATLGLTTNRANQIATDKDLRCVDDAAIRVIGDCAAVPDGDSGRTLSATAQAARQEAEWLADALVALDRGETPEPFVFKPQGMLVSLGKYRAVGSLAAIVGPKRDYHVEGRSAKMMYVSLYRMHQAAIHGWPMAMLLWAGDKLKKAARPTLKLH
ncbi:NAD(P)/FAD-dependent oxidoreductase [Jeongeupia sp. USM3]|uniref:NAD(P)/FAD-dependent oxidoreductase n=1 Tax=Jeongeupia sp. USM3 TaxID=1906741 RepID=UPI00089DF2AD|nr:NAD(P)/FAD-dependent oxidoreductase [Jeongeupia sp. USM3]AOY01140.1 FAD-dependent oxidoreductase [Jeongeupia sp. USM3]